MKREMTRGEMRLYLTGNASVWVGKILKSYHDIF